MAAAAALLRSYGAFFYTDHGEVAAAAAITKITV